MEIIAKMLNSSSKVNFWLLAKVINRVIPFNKPHDFTLMEGSNGLIQVKIPYARKNMNHLKGIHACAMATGGELVAGLNLIKNFDVKKYRLIMSELRVEYFKQGRTDLFCESSLNEEMEQTIRKNLEDNGEYFVEMKTYLKNPAQDLIATVTTNWQLKDWNKIKSAKK